MSSYTPLCKHCGLILCELNLPCYACPHCKSSLLSPNAANALVSSLEELIIDTLEREDLARREAAEEARRAAGAFPTLGGPLADATLRSHNSSATNPTSIETHPVNRQHKVLSLNSTSKGKRVTVTSYKTVPPAATSSVVKVSQEPPEPVMKRVPRPPKEVMCLSKVDAERPWRNTRVEPVTYIPAPSSNSAGPSKSKNKRKGKQSGDKENTGKERSDG